MATCKGTDGASVTSPTRYRPLLHRRGGEKNLKKIKKAAALLLCLLFLAGAGHPVTAAGEGGQADAPDVPTVTFTNKENTTPDLNVVKYVESLDPAYPAPAEAEFTFVIKVDGELYKNQEYELYKADAPGKAPELHRTDRNGSFTLKAGERARFVYLGAGKHYEVYEEALPDNFVQLIPAAGTSVTGTIPPSGAQAAFTNQYQPPGEPPGPNPKPETTKLLVSKRIAFPSGYTPPESPDFRFRVTIDGKPYGDEPYEIVSLDTGLPLGSGVTAGPSTPEGAAGGEPGGFTLKAGEQAVFTGIPVDVDYKVEELLEGGWWSVNDVTSQEGATKAPAVTVDFTNANTSFIVTKQLEDNSKPDVSFTFTLMRGDRSHWAGAVYYLYSTKGNLLDKPGQPHVTDEHGRFTLKPGQAAVFFGIEPGTLYHVSEQKDPGYSQLTPIDPAGYTDKVVQKNVEVLPFVNRKEEMKGVLTVTKQVEAENGVSPENPQEFTFCISKKTEEGSSGGTGGDGSAGGAGFVPMGDVPYQVGTGTTTRNGRTKEDGTFTLKAGETARFESLLKGCYQVEELTEGLSPEYSIQEKVQTGDLLPGQEEGLAFTFVNRFRVLPLSIQLQKTGWSKDTLLPGAVFRLYRDKGLADEILPEGWETEHPGQAFVGYVTSDEGTVLIPDLQAGTYYLKEVQAPEGYQLLANPLEIVITRKGDKLEATVNSIKPSPGSDGQVTIEDNTVTIRIRNSKNFTLPATGGEGIAFLLAAAAGAALVLGILWKKGKVKIKK